MQGSNTFMGMILVLIGFIFFVVGMRKRGTQLLKGLNA